MIYNMARVRRLWSGGYFQNFMSIHAKLKKIDLHMHSCAHVVEIQAIIYNVGRVRRLSTKFQGDACKSKEYRSAHAQLRTL